MENKFSKKIAYNILRFFDCVFVIVMLSSMIYRSIYHEFNIILFCAFIFILGIVLGLRIMRIAVVILTKNKPF